MKKKILIVLVAVFFSLGIIGCAPKTSGTINVYMPDGAPALAMAKLMYENKIIGNKKVKYTIVEPSTLSTYVSNKTADLAIVPVNLAANLYNKGNNYKLVSVNTFGNLFMVGYSMANNLKALEGNIVGVIGQGLVPDLTLRYLLEQKGINYNIYTSDNDVKADEITLRYFKNGGELMPLLGEGKGKIKFGLLAEPAVSTALSSHEGLNLCFDLSKIWKEVKSAETYPEEYTEDYPQACLIINSDKDYGKFVKEFCNELEKNMEWLKHQPEKALDAISSHMYSGTASTIKKLDEKIIENCKIGYKPAIEAQDNVIAFLNALGSLNMQVIGGKIPDTKFFFGVPTLGQ